MGFSLMNISGVPRIFLWRSFCIFFLDILGKSELVATHRLGNVNQKETIHEYKFKSKPNMNHDMRVRFLI